MRNSKFYVKFGGVFSFLLFCALFFQIQKTVVWSKVDSVYVSVDRSIDVAAPNSTKACSTYTDIGSSSSYGGHIYRYLAKFDFNSFVISPAQVTKAVFKIDQVSASWDGGGTYETRQITQEWNPSTVTWSNQPAIDPTAIIMNGKSFSIFTADVTDIVKNWLMNTSTNNGLLVKKTNEDINVEANKGSFVCANYPTNGSQNRPVLEITSCFDDEWTCGVYGICHHSGIQNRTCTKTLDCPNVDTLTPTTTQQCVAPTCQEDTWVCSDWGSCSASGSQIRNCQSIFDCPDIDTPSPSVTQNCTPTPVCSEDIWTCDTWEACGVGGIQLRKCKKTFDCPTAETPSPNTLLFCTPNNTEQPAPPSSVPPTVTPTPPITALVPAPAPVIDDIFDQNIIKSTVQVICEQGKQRIYGSGTVIKESGIILTNKHVLEGEGGKLASKCFIGFTIDPDADPTFSDISTPSMVAKDEDIAVLTIINPSQSSYNWVDISKSSVNSSKFGGKIKVVGYPAIGGANMTYSSGDFSGFGSQKESLGNYIKTTAVIEHGNSGGGSYTGNGVFIGIPTFVRKGTLNSLGFLLSVNKINKWLAAAPAPTKAVQSAAPTNLNPAAYLENISDLVPPDLSQAKITVNKKQSNRPKFTVSGVEDNDSGVAGYYYYFGVNALANPLAKGKFSRLPSFTTPIIKTNGAYYFILVAKDKSGNISEPLSMAYSYKKKK